MLPPAQLSGGRDPAAAARVSPDRETHILAVGDILLADAAQKRLNRHGYDYPFRAVASCFERADLVVGNLEGPITEQASPRNPRKSYVYKAAPEAARALHAFGFRLLCLANNHALDHGEAGLADTMQALEAQGIRYFGAGRTHGKAVAGVTVELAGYRLGFLGFWPRQRRSADTAEHGPPAALPCIARAGADTIGAAIRAMRSQADVVIVSFHWGRNYASVTPAQQACGRAAVECGADLVIGHHPHIAQGVELYRGVPILYSLGNFTFGTHGRFRLVDPLRRHGWVADIAVRGGRVTQVDLIPIEIDNRVVKFQPRPVRPAALPRLLAALPGQGGGPLAIVDDGGAAYARARLSTDG